MDDQRPLRARRSGAALLGLLIASNFLPCTELLAGNTAAAELAGREEIIAGIGSCLIAAAAVFAAWLIGRRSPSARSPRIPRPRAVGLRLALLGIAANLGLAGTLLALEPESPLGGGSGAVLFFAVWSVTVLPIEVAAAYFHGRASDRIAGREGVPIEHAR